jgi:ribosomal protein L22
MKSKEVFETVKSAVHNAKHKYGIDSEKLIVEQAFVSPGRTLKRVSMHGRVCDSRFLCW